MEGEEDLYNKSASPHSTCMQQSHSKDEDKMGGLGGVPPKKQNLNWRTFWMDSKCLPKLKYASSNIGSSPILGKPDWQGRNSHTARCQFPFEPYLISHNPPMQSWYKSDVQWGNLSNSSPNMSVITCSWWSSTGRNLGGHRPGFITGWCQWHLWVC